MSYKTLCMGCATATCTQVSKHRCPLLQLIRLIVLHQVINRSQPLDTFRCLSETFDWGSAAVKAKINRQIIKISVKILVTCLLSVLLNRLWEFTKGLDGQDCLQTCRRNFMLSVKGCIGKCADGLVKAIYCSTSSYLSPTFLKQLQDSKDNKNTFSIFSGFYGQIRAVHISDVVLIDLHNLFQPPRLQ